MIFEYNQSKIEGVFELLPKMYTDERGNIVKTFHKESYKELGLECDFGESLITSNFQRGVIRGFHFQRPPYCQAKTLYCLKGSVFDAVIDLRVGSPTYGQTDTFELSEQKHSVLYLPTGVANCYLIMEDNTFIAYNLTSKYMPGYDGGLRWDSAGISFPIASPIISRKDAILPPLDELVSPFVYGAI